MSKKANLDQIFEIGSEVLKTNTRTGATLYKPELFTGKSNKEKKSLRVKLRRRKDNFIASFIAYKNDKEKLNELRSAWQQYAKNVYVDVNKIIDNNSSEQNKDDALRFLNFINQVDSKTNKK